MLPILLICCAAIALAEEMQTHHFHANGTHIPAGWPEDTVTAVLALAEKPLRFEFDSDVASPPTVTLHRVTFTRKISIDAPVAESRVNGWQWIWTPPQTRGPAQYEVRFDSEPAHIILIESRDPDWFKKGIEMLGNANWAVQGLSRDELAALANQGLRVSSSGTSGSNPPASLQMIPKEGNASRRRVVWDKVNPTLVVWRPGPASGDWEIRAPRWWISPAALATDHGLIRFIDLFSEPPLNP